MPLPRGRLGQKTADRDTRHLRVKLNLQQVAGGDVTDHGTLLGLADDDHAQYVHLSAARTITGQHSFTPGSPAAPFLLGANAQGQLVTGLRADELNKNILSSGLGLSGGGGLTTSQTITLTSSSNPGAAAAILASDASGHLQLVRLGLGITPTSPVHIRNITGPQTKIDYDASNHLEIDVASDGELRFNTTGTDPWVRFQHDVGLGITTDPLSLLHLRKTTLQLQIDYDVSNYLTVTVDSNGNATLGSAGAQASLILAPAGDIVVDPTGDDVLPLITDDINLGALNKKYKTLHVSELWVTTLVAAEVLATIGGQIVVSPTTTLESDLSSTILVLNGDFELRTGDDFDDWIERENFGATVVADTVEFQSGAVSCKITQGTDPAGGGIAQTNWTGTRRKTYQLTFWYKIGAGDGSGTIRIVDQEAEIALLDWVSIGTATSWTQVGFTFTTTSVTLDLDIEFRAGPSNLDILWLDDVRMWMSTVEVEHNFFDDNDWAVMKSAGKLEYMRFNELLIAGADQASDWFEFNSGLYDMTSLFPATELFQIRGSTGNDGTYTVASSTFTGGKTRVFVDEEIPSATGDGYLAYSYSIAGGPYKYHRLQRDGDDTGMNDWYIGDAIVKLGVVGDGFLDIYSVQGLDYGAGPTIVGNVRTSTVYNGFEERWAIGNLNGLYGYAADEYGAAFGEPSGTRITIEPTSGIRFYANNLLRGEMQPAGTFWFGDTATSERLQWDVTNGLQLFNSSNSATFKAPPSGNIQIIGTLDVTGAGVITAGSGTVKLDGTGIQIAYGGADVNWLSWDGFDSGRLARVTATQVSNLVQMALECENITASGADSSVISIRAKAGTTQASVVLQADENGSDSWVEIDDNLVVGFSGPKDQTLYVDGDAFISTKLYINETINTKQTRGITINGGTAANEVLSFKSSNVSHGVTGVTETDTFGIMQINHGDWGALRIHGFGDDGNPIGLDFRGTAETPTSGSNTGTFGAVLISGSTFVTTTLTALASDENVVVMRNNTLTRWILKGDGEIHSDFHTGGGTGHANYDDYNDAQLLRAFDIQHSALETADAWFNQNLQTLQDLGIIHDVRPDGMFVSQQKMTKLQIGAIWQLYQRMETQTQRIRELESQVQRMQ